MTPNEEMLYSIKILMEKSFWGTNSSVDSLIQNLRSEVQEFIQACENYDESNAKEEAADVLMIILCALYRIVDFDKYSADDIAERVTSKLNRRYSHLYSEVNLHKNEKELDIWANAKKVEHRINLMFCDNCDCPQYEKIQADKIVYKKGKYWCEICGSQIIPSSDNVFLYRSKQATSYMKEICDSILAFAEGDSASAIRLCIDHPRAFHALISQILYSNSAHNFEKIFVEYVNQKYHVLQADIRQYLVSAREVQKEMNEKKMDIMESYYEEIKKGNYQAKALFSITQWTRIANNLCELTFDVAKKIDRAVSFNARSWDNQTINKYLLHYPDSSSSTLIECMTIIHYKGDQYRDLTVELSNMYNCVVGCRFCASGALPGKTQYLEAIDYVKQLNTCLKQSGISPSDFKNFYVSFAGIGEPSIVCEAIAAGISIIRDIYPDVQFNIATFGYREKCFQYWRKLDLPIRTLQIPLYHTDNNKLKNIVSGLPVNYNFEKVLAEAIGYKNSHPMCRVKVNYIPMQGVNDSNSDIENFMTVLRQYKRAISVKISFLNYTKPAEKNGFVTPGKKRLDEIQRIFQEQGFIAYVFGSDQNTALGCGQLAQNCISGKI